MLHQTNHAKKLNNLNMNYLKTNYFRQPCLKNLLLSALLLTGMYLGVCFPAHAQIPVVDGLSNKQLIKELLKWVQDYMKQNQQDKRLAKILGENTAAGEKLKKLLDLKQQIEKELYLAKDFRKLRISDLSKIKSEVYGLPASDRYVTEVPYVREFVTMTGKTASVENSQKAYDYLFDGTSAYQPENSGSLTGYVENSKQAKAKQYALAIAAQKRKISVAMSYQRLSNQYTTLAEDLSKQITRDGEQKMSTGERIQAQKLANDYMLKSVEMKKKADQLLREASEKSKVVQQVDHSYQAARMRKQLSQTQVE
ncbi:hypothetical protein [Xanthocytophaga flavus]|nr:hypothetical protein [Xanthocytophaga flavus]